MWDNREIPEITNEEKEFLAEGLVYGPGAGLDFRVRPIHIEEIGRTRWMSRKVAYFEVSGYKGLFSMEYGDGLTELQEGDYPGLYEGNHHEFPIRRAAVTEKVIKVKEYKTLREKKSE